MKPINKHGGKRLNAGRKTKDPDGPVVRVVTWISAKQAKYFADSPHLNRTDEIKKALDAWIFGVEKSAIKEIENAMERWHHGRVEDSETLEKINQILAGVGLLEWFNKQSNELLVGRLVTVLKTPITERYCKVGDTATLDLENKQIRCSGSWFNFDERWVVQPCP